MTTTPVTRFRLLFADDKSLYGITAAGALLWYPAWTDSSGAPSVDAGKPIGSDWAEFSHVFPGGDGILYAITLAGELLWYQDVLRNGTNAADGSSGWAAASGSQIGLGWNAFATVFSGGEGLIYGITTSGQLLWYRDLARDGSNSADGSTGWAVGSGSQIGTGWLGFRHVVSGGGGVIYAVTAKGDLLWYRDDRQDGSNGPDGCEGWAAASGVTIGNGWDFFAYLFAGADGEIFACHAQEFGGTVRRYRDLLRDGTNAFADGWLTNPATAAGGWQIAAIEGYAWPPSVPAGGTVRFHVSASTPGRGTVSYQRLGGRGPRMGVMVGSSADFDCNFQAGGTFSSDCAWPAACELVVPEQAPSWGPGFYAARVQGRSGPPFDIPLSGMMISAPWVSAACFGSGLW
jgi:tachylectin